jgi:uncharacterized protein (TIGR03435 family)
MLQALLKERFKLETHMESKELPVMVLVVAKGGPKITASTAPPEDFGEDASLNPGEMKVESPDGPMRVTMSEGGGTMNMGRNGSVTLRMDGDRSNQARFSCTSN